MIDDSPTGWPLTCPETSQPLTELRLAEAQACAGHPLVPVRAWPGRRAHGEAPRPIGPTPTVMLRADARAAYPVLDGVPVLLAPERLGRAGERWEGSLCDRRYAEPYDEMPHYDEQGLAETAEDSVSMRALQAALSLPPAARGTFPHPRDRWLDSVYDSAAQYDAFRHLAPLEGKRVMELGGRGVHSSLFLLGGADEAWTVTPMPGEARCADALARRAGVAGRHRCAIAVAEQLPFEDASFDAIYSNGSVHHMATELAFAEIARVLKPGGRFSAVEPWRAPLYGIGTRLLGKREPGTYCTPLTAERLAPLPRAFPGAKVVHHGALTRYALLALQKFGLELPLAPVWAVTRADDWIASWLPPVRRAGSSVAILGTAPNGTTPRRDGGRAPGQG